MRSKYWGDPDWLWRDVKVKPLKSGGEAGINLFNWNKVVKIPTMIDGIKITSLRLVLNNKHLTKLIAPVTVKRINRDALAKCTNLQEAILLGVTEIKATAFWDCKKLKALWVADKLNHVDSDAFPRGIKLTIYGPESSFAAQYATRK